MSYEHSTESGYPSEVPEGILTKAQVTRELASFEESSQVSWGPEEARFIEEMERSEQKLLERIKQPITFSKPIIWWNDCPIIFPHTVNLIQGQSGSHKSRLAEVMASVLLSPANRPEDLLGMTKRPDYFPIIAYVDTERNLKEQFPYALQNIKRKAGFTIDANLPNFRFASLMPFERSERFKALKAWLTKLRADTDQHIVVVLDVVTDCVSDFNRTDASMELLDLLNRAINQSDVTFICVIHENPGQGKARGHLGTEALNKSTTSIQIGFELDRRNNPTDLIRAKFLKTRASKRPPPIYLWYDETINGLALADGEQISDAVESRRSSVFLPDLTDALSRQLSPGPMFRKELLENLTEEFGTSERTISDRLKEVESQAVPVVANDVTYRLDSSQKEGRNKIYQLLPLKA